MSLENVLHALDQSGVTYSECLAGLLTSPRIIGQPSIVSVSKILQVLILAKATKAETEQWALSMAREIYRNQMATLGHKGSGLQFGMAKTMTEERLKNFSIDTLASEMQKHTPDLWELLSVLLSADPQRSYKWEWA